LTPRWRRRGRSLPDDLPSGAPPVPFQTRNLFPHLSLHRRIVALHLSQVRFLPKPRLQRYRASFRHPILRAHRDLWVIEKLRDGQRVQPVHSSSSLIFPPPCLPPPLRIFRYFCNRFWFREGVNGSSGALGPLLLVRDADRCSTAVLRLIRRKSKQPRRLAPKSIQSPPNRPPENLSSD